MNQRRGYSILPRKQYEYRDTLTTALQKSEYIDYVYNDGPLTAAEVPEQVRDSEAFREFVDVMGWPDSADEVITPLTIGEPELARFNDSKDLFVIKFQSLNSLDPSKNLNNFRQWLISTPHQHTFTDMTDVYGSHPALHRLHVLLPEVMESVRALLLNLEARHNGSRYAIADELSVDANKELVKSIMMIYAIAGRLLKVDDTRRQEKILFPDREPEAADITDARTALSQ